MDQKPAIWLGMLVGTTLGGFISSFFGGSLFSVSSLLLTGLGGLAGIWAGFELSR